MKVKKKIKKNNSFLETSPLSKGLILLGIILLLTYGTYSIVSSNTSSENIHEDQIRGTGTMDWIIPISIIIIFVGIIFSFINHQLVKLSEFAQEIESGEFEEKVLKELDNK